MGLAWFSSANSRRRCGVALAAAVGLGAALSALPAGATRSADDMPCATSGVLYDIDRNDRKRLESILKDASEAENGQSVLWRIEKPGVAPSYLLGTVHVIDPSLQTLSEAVTTALDNSRVLAVESAAQPEGPSSLAAAETRPLMVSLDKELRAILADDELAVVERALADAGYPSAMALGLKPWAATMFLADSKCQKELRDSGLRSLDELLVDRAHVKNIEVKGLESMLEQYRSMAAISQDAQIAWLKASIGLYPRVDDMSQTISELYRFRRLDAVWRLTQALAPNAGLTDATLSALRADLVSRRNARLAERAARLIDEGGAFVAVGGLHLSGPDGLVALLKQKNYTLTPIE